MIVFADPFARRAFVVGACFGAALTALVLPRGWARVDHWAWVAAAERRRKRRLRALRPKRRDRRGRWS